MRAIRQVLGFLLLVAAAAVTAGGAFAQASPDPPDPQALVARAHAALEAGDFEAAGAALDQALESRRKYMPAHEARLELALATRNWEQGFDWLREASRRVRTRGDRRMVTALEIDMLSASRPSDGWYTRSKGLYLRLLRRDPGARKDRRLTLAVARSAMAAHLRDQDTDFLDDADRYLRRAIALGGPEAAVASRLLVDIDRRRQANIGGGRVAGIANQPTLTRTQMVYLLSSELDLKSYAGEADISSPRGGEAGKDGSSDYGGLEIAESIRTVHRMNFRSLHVDDGLFRPDRLVSREELAILLEDLLLRRDGNPDAGRRFIGSVSPFPDVAATRVSFNAIMAAVSRGLLSTGTDANFNPAGAATGSEAVLAVRHIRSLDSGTQ